MTSTRRTFFGSLFAGIGAVCFGSKVKPTKTLLSPVYYPSKDGGSDMIFRQSEWMGKWSVRRPLSAKEWEYTKAWMEKRNRIVEESYDYHKCVLRRSKHD